MSCVSAIGIALLVIIWATVGTTTWTDGRPKDLVKSSGTRRRVRITGSSAEHHRVGAVGRELGVRGHRRNSGKPKIGRVRKSGRGQR